MGCSRNFLLCSWPSPPNPALEDGAVAENVDPRGFSDYGVSEQLDTKRHGKQIMPANDLTHHSGCSYLEPILGAGPGNILPCLESLFATSSTHSKALASPREQRLFQHFHESTSGMLAARGFCYNPFVTCLLPLAMTNDGIMHTILAISASHYTSALGNDSLYALGRQHYAIAIRFAKHQITKFARGMCDQPLVLAALLLSLCEFEVMPPSLPALPQAQLTRPIKCVDGSLHGAVLHHLNAVTQILAQVPPSWLRSCEPLCEFIAELYTFLTTVSRNFGLAARHTTPQLHIMHKKVGLEGTFGQLYGFMFGCAYDLYMLIPQIQTLAVERHSQPNEDLHCEAEFRAIETQIGQWKPSEDITGKDVSDALKVSGLMLQQALYVYLSCAIHGPGKPNSLLLYDIQPKIQAFLNLMSLLPPACSEWTTMSWPMLVVGSCVRDQVRREIMLDCANERMPKMFGAYALMRTLRWLWESDDPTAFGPWGIEKIMTERNVRLCVG